MDRKYFTRQTCEALLIVVDVAPSAIYCSVKVTHEFAEIESRMRTKNRTESSDALF